MNISVSIPDEVKCLINPSQTVDFSTPFLENKVISQLAIPVAIKLNIPSDKIFNYLKKFAGDTVEKGEILAEKKGLISNSTVISGSKGTLKEINHNTGEIIISTLTSKSGHITAFFKGEAVEIDKNQLILKVKDSHEFSLKQTNSEFGGETFYLKDPSKPIFAPQMLNKIMVCEIITPYLLTKTEALGIKGFITLRSISPDSNLAKAQIKNIEDFKKVFHLNLPYCLINKQYSKIYFYR